MKMFGQVSVVASFLAMTMIAHKKTFGKVQNLPKVLCNWNLDPSDSEQAKQFQKLEFSYSIHL
jgi:uncharacterized membrane protein YdfJ with MMPL/SSD domain